MCMILLGLLLCVGFSQAVESVEDADIASCSTGNETTTTLKPYNDTVVGRYLAEWCINVNPEATLWKIQLSFYSSDRLCTHPPKDTLYSQGVIHSRYQESIKVEGNCTHVCLNTVLDLIFNACYLLKTSFLVNNHERNITDKFIYINNKYKEEQFKNNSAILYVHNQDGENITLVWHTGVPFHSCYIKLTKKITTSLNETKLEKVEEEPECNAPSQLEVRCRMRLPPGEYHTLLQLYAPWVHGVFRDQEFVTFNFTVQSPTVPVVEAAPAWPWAVGAFVLVVVLGALTCWACRTREARTLHKQVLVMWRAMMERDQTSPVPVRAPQRHILMLYAREGAVAAKFCAALRDMLQEAPDTQVYDIFSPEVLSMAASGPHAWVRGMLQRPDVAVLLLQTPALAALYQQQLQDTDNTIKLQEPLLGRRLLYRAPQYGDTLLQYAVMLTAEAAHARNNYHKYYIATLSELPTEMFAQLVPYRRYLLPGGASCLANNLCDFTPSQESLDTLTAAAREFVDLAKDNPDYLMDELMLIS